MRTEESIVKAITVDEDIAKISILEVPDKPGVAFKLFSKIGEAGIKIESIVQNVNRNAINDITFTVHTDDFERAFNITSEYALEVGATRVIYDKGVAKLSVVGSGIIANTEVASRFFKALYEKGVNIQMITTSEVKISCVIEKSIAKEALKQIYKEFEV